jgi:hypothetical protein
MKDNTDKLRTEARQDLLARGALTTAKEAGREQQFLCLQTKHPQEYKTAFNSWAVAMWKWIDEGVTPEQENVWRAKLLAERRRFCPVNDSTASVIPGDLDMEHWLQSFLVERAFFKCGLHHKKDGDPVWFQKFAQFQSTAKLLNDALPFVELAGLTKRKTSRKQLGKRSLRFWILYLWIPGCFWAMQNGGITAYLRWRKPDGTESEYSEHSVSNMVSELKLWRPFPPLYWGIGSDGLPTPVR